LWQKPRLMESFLQANGAISGFPGFIAPEFALCAGRL
jgi:hypothetical protein